LYVNYVKTNKNKKIDKGINEGWEKIDVKNYADG
jgi:hypothetical protein